MVKCNICGNKLKEMWLGKLKGTVVFKKDSSKQYTVCFECQKKLGSKEKIMEAVK